ncbi:alpha/beta hydrolase family esterase [Dietzia sp. PP-33]|uniref:alpha/beta hydrolase family esterase n=1 Tax=Dietzia sp. PP-33 TaxID=2957500 RepID=UPI0029BF23BA|nr:alpha/beta hydrolase-fold protein [Dietzia sp. PP-33]MDX2355371.1 hypothetical protein [Dietzia sp. PP-33]
MNHPSPPPTLGLAACLVLATVVGACAAPPGDPLPSVVGPGDDSEGLSGHSVVLDEVTRTWSAYRPPGTALDPAAPVLLVIHGTGDSGSGIRHGIGPELERLADRHGFSIAYVDGHQNNWNECRREGDWPAKEKGLDDVGLMREVIDSLDTTGPVYAVGFSSGGHMAMRLALEAPDLVDAVAAVAANPPTRRNLDCPADGEAVPIMFVQGREDTINPIDGGEVRVGSGVSAKSRGDVLSAVDGAAWFADRNGVAGDGTVPPGHTDGDAETITWEGLDPVRLVMVDRVGHSFPTLSGRWDGDGGAEYDAPGEIWRFFTSAAP